MSDYKAEYTYKCRLCGLVYADHFGGWHQDIIATEVFVVTHGDTGAFKNIHKIESISYHMCPDGSLGVTDFIGVKKTDA